MWFCVSASCEGGSGDILWSEKSTLAASHSTSVVDFGMPCVTLQRWKCKTQEEVASCITFFKAAQGSVILSPGCRYLFTGCAFTQKTSRWCCEEKVQKGSIINSLTAMKTPAEQRLTFIWFPPISTQQNNKARELIGSYLLNMNLGTRWCCTDVISRLP